MERKKQLEIGLIGLMKAIGMSMYRALFCLAEIRAYHLQDKMVEWVVSCREKEDTITPQSFTAKLNELIAEKQTNGK